MRTVSRVRTEQAEGSTKKRVTGGLRGPSPEYPAATHEITPGSAAAESCLPGVRLLLVPAHIILFVFDP